MICPDELVVTIELIGSVAREENGTFETLNDVPLYDRPVPAVVVATHVGTPLDIARINPFVPFTVTPSVPFDPDVVMRPFVVRLERVAMFCEVLTVTALVAPVYVKPVENVVVALLNLEKSDAFKQPLTDADAAVHPNDPDEPPRN
jgi:hypothetical protein